MVPSGLARNTASNANTEGGISLPASEPFSDPEEVDISRSTLVDGTNTASAFKGPVAHEQGGGRYDDPMAQMVQQMLGGAGFGANARDGPIPPAFANILGGLSEQQEQQQHQQEHSKRSTAYMWRLLHGVFSLSLALYIALFASNFDGSKLQRTRSDFASDTVDSPAIHRSFWALFATAELCLQVSRYFVERGQLPPSSLAGGLARFLPDPWAGYVRLFGRYGVIYSTVVADAMIVVFVLGMISWWKVGVEG